MKCCYFNIIAHFTLLTIPIFASRQFDPDKITTLLLIIIISKEEVED